MTSEEQDRLEFGKVARLVTRACRVADQAYEKAGCSGTRTWVYDFFLPALEAEGLAFVRKAVDEEVAPTAGECSVKEATEGACTTEGCRFCAMKEDDHE